ncbi:hypothetical protein J1614_011105 [Plenodomus biglobosus]|nr:hypothetical protein J1614_011105 [Plenodomus biglobosus]
MKQNPQHRNAPYYATHSQIPTSNIFRLSIKSENPFHLSSLATMVASNKDRIYVALYARGGQDPDTYHWAITIGPKNEVEGGRDFLTPRKTETRSNEAWASYMAL